MPNVRRRCPFCFKRTGSAGTHENVSINVEQGVFFCWRCGAKGPVTKRLAALFGVDHNPYTSAPIDAEQQKGKRYPDGYNRLNRLSVDVVTRRFAHYLRRRRLLTWEQIEHFQIGVILGRSVRKGWAGALAFPSRDREHRGWIYRLRDGRYQVDAGFSSKLALYDAVCMDHDGATLFVVEGALDRIRLYPARAVAGFGKDLTETQIDRLAQYSGPVVFALDGDAWRYAQACAMQLALRGHSGAYYVKLPPATDPADLGIVGVANAPRIKV